MSFTVAVAGATGYAGGEILRLLLNHPAYQSGDLSLGSLTAHGNAGRKVSAIMPGLSDLADRVIDDTTPEILAGHDVVFLSLPHGHSAEIAQHLAPETFVIDCAADFRLVRKQDWAAYYGGEYAGSWPYGIPEIPGRRAVIASSRRVAVPGCFPTGATLAALPAIAGNLVEPDLTVVSVSGVSGAGKKASVPLLGAETMGSLKAYNTAGRHRHTPEIAQNIREATGVEARVSFTPVLAPLPRGILTTLSAPIRPGVTTEQAQEEFRAYYAEEKFVRILPGDQQPQTQYVVGTNMCHMQVEVDTQAQKLLVTTAIDNLTKGTAGAAVQCMNIMIGFDEAAGLPTAAVAP